MRQPGRGRRGRRLAFGRAPPGGVGKQDRSPGRNSPAPAMGATVEVHTVYRYPFEYVVASYLRKVNGPKALPLPGPKEESLHHSPSAPEFRPGLLLVAMLAVGGSPAPLKECAKRAKPRRVQFQEQPQWQAGSKPSPCFG